MKLLTCSISLYDLDNAEALCDYLYSVADELKLCDVSVMLEYNNIIFDCYENNIELLTDSLIESLADVEWELMLSDGELIIKLINYNGQSLSTQLINMTMDEIAENNRQECDSSDCFCENNDSTLSEKIDAIRETINANKGDELFASLVTALHNELDNYVESQVDEELQEEIFGLFYNSITQCVLFFAKIGDYNKAIHEYVVGLLGNIDYGYVARTQCEALDEIIKTVDFWHDAKQYSHNGVFDALTALCIFVCCIGGEIDTKSTDMLNMLYNK